MERLNSLSLDTNKIKGAKLGSNEITRCIGNYFLKGGYKEFDMLASATAEASYLRALYYFSSYRRILQNPTTSNTSSDDEDLTLRGNYDESISHLRRPPRTTFGPLNAQESTENESTSPSIFHTSTTSTESSKLSNPSLTQLTLDEDGRIRPYTPSERIKRIVWR
ncbi:hypothetical protein Anas_13295 [Armadillidium nasatum]|uniref:Uncharacterized protein n=1 Tax=Armadillidium nasatum TaxID=96803 RepID=A0A5N5T4P1_9CRUS|nr:hypothetical protein Anas_13295 [Armadillidium nasatum]